MSKMMVKRDGLWAPMENLKGDTGPLPADNSVTNDALVTDGAKTSTAYLMHNRLTKDAEGEFISIDDSYPSAALSLTVDGKSTQVTTTGKNLLNPTVAANAGGWLRRRTSNNSYGTIVDSVGTSCNIFLVPLEDGQSLTYSRGSATKLGFHFVWSTDKTLAVGSVLTDIVTLTNYSRRTFTNSTGDTVYVGVAASVNSTTADPGVLENAEAQLEYATAFTSYEPYSGGAASPRPDWPQEIVSIDAPSLHATGINMFDISTAWLGTSYGGQWYASTYHGDINTISKIDGGVLVDPHNSNHGLYVSLGHLPAGSYIISLDKLENAPATLYTYPREPAYGTHPQLVSIGVIASNGETSRSKEFTLSENAWVLVGVYRSNNDPMGIFNIQLTPASIDSQYSTFVGNIGSLLPEGTSLRSLPDGTKDELYLKYLKPSSRDGWAWYEPTLIQRVGYVDMGTLGWARAYPGKDYEKFWAPVADMAKLTGYGIRIMSENYRGYNNGNAYALLPDFSVAMRSDTGYMSVKDPRFDNAGDFKAAVNGVMAYYPLATPITTQLDPIELPIMQAGITNIWSNPSTNLSVTYERDRNIVISNLEAAAADLATS